MTFCWNMSVVNKSKKCQLHVNLDLIIFTIEVMWVIDVMPVGSAFLILFSRSFCGYP